MQMTGFFHKNRLGKLRRLREGSSAYLRRPLDEKWTAIFRFVHLCTTWLLCTGYDPKKILLWFSGVPGLGYDGQPLPRYGHLERDGSPLIHELRGSHLGRGGCLLLHGHHFLCNCRDRAWLARHPRLSQGRCCPL
jgi:hypothetical protein